jgi:hypothetical protein
MITLGHTYKDTITGFTGVATGYVKYITGCNQALLTPKTRGGGGLNEPHWFDEQRLKPVKGAAVITLDNGATTGARQGCTEALISKPGATMDGSFMGPQGAGNITRPEIDWTPERIALLTRLWDEGRTAASIAMEIGCTKNAVVGKAHRLRLRGRPSPI